MEPEFGSEVDRRRRAVELVTEVGASVTDAARLVGRSRQWVHKWLGRYREEGDAGLADRSRAPGRQPGRIDARTIAAVLGIRDDLEKNPVASEGAISIRATMERQNWEPLPSLRSIERIVARAGRSRTYMKRTRSGVRLPLPEVTLPGVWQQADWIQDRYLQGGIRFQSLQASDVGSGVMASEQYLDRTVRTAVTFLLEKAWPVMSIPLAMGTDNAFVKTTWPNNPFTLWTRLCLYFGVEVIVAPPGGLGWTNHIEAVNNLWQNRTIRVRHFKDLDELRAGSAEACHWLNHYRPLHDPAIHGTRYPIEVVAQASKTLRWPPPITLSDHQNHKGKILIPLSAGRITYLRHVTEKHTIEVANVIRQVPQTVPEGGLVTATITTHDQTLTLRHQGIPIAAHPYPINHPIVDPFYPPATKGLLEHV